MVLNEVVKPTSSCTGPSRSTLVISSFAVVIWPPFSIRPMKRAVDRMDRPRVRSTKLRSRPSACTNSAAPTTAVVFGSSMRLDASRNG